MGVGIEIKGSLVIPRLIILIFDAVAKAYWLHITCQYFRYIYADPISGVCGWRRSLLRRRYSTIFETANRYAQPS